MKAIIKQLIDNATGEIIMPNSHIDAIVDNSGKALSTILNEKANKSDLLDPLSKQDTLVDDPTRLDQNIKTINGVRVLGKGNIEVFDKSEYYNKTDIDGKNFLTEHQDISGKLDTTIYTEDKKTFALKTELQDKQDFLNSGSGINIDSSSTTIESLSRVQEIYNIESVNPANVSNSSNSNINFLPIYDTKGKRILYKESPTRYYSSHQVFHKYFYEKDGTLRKNLILAYDNRFYTIKKDIIGINTIEQKDLDTLRNFGDCGIYTVLSGNPGPISSIGTVSVFADNLNHVTYQVLNTSLLVKDGILTDSHVDGVLYRWKRFYNRTSPSAAIPLNSWGPWKPDDLTESIIRSEKVTASSILELKENQDEFTATTSASLNDLFKRVLELEANHGSGKVLPKFGKLGNTFFLTTTESYYVHNGTGWIKIATKIV